MQELEDDINQTDLVGDSHEHLNEDSLLDKQSWEEDALSMKETLPDDMD